MKTLISRISNCFNSDNQHIYNNLRLQRLVIAIAGLGVSLQSCTLFDKTPKPSLRSVVGVDYSTLDTLLRQQQWKAADQETLRLMLFVRNRTDEGWLSEEDLNQFPCEDLNTLDRLWEDHSQGQFGFSVQRVIWEDIGGPDQAYRSDLAEQFGDRVGWRKNEQWQPYEALTFDETAPVGHLPASTGGGVSGGIWGGTASIAQQLKSCSQQFPDVVYGERPKATWRSLEKALARREWVTADWLTLELMQEITGKTDTAQELADLDLGPDSLANFPCEELQRLDRLWSKYSEGRFGFSVQQQLYLETGNQPGDLHWGHYEAFIEKVGWNVPHMVANYHLRFPNAVPKGHFPFRMGWDNATFGSGFFREWRSYLNPSCNV